nr:glutathione S-transferase L3-like isoform X2 [Tanacetum cinerariifolium]
MKLVPIDLANRPVWYKEKVYPKNKVPALEHDNKITGESLDLMRYVDAHFEGPALLPNGKRNLKSPTTRAELLALSGKEGLQDKIKLVPLDLANRPAWYKEKVYPENKDRWIDATMCIIRLDCGFVMLDLMRLSLMLIDPTRADSVRVDMVNSVNTELPRLGGFRSVSPSHLDRF